MKIKENVERKFCPLHQLVQSHRNPAILHASFFFIKSSVHAAHIGMVRGTNMVGM